MTEITITIKKRKKTPNNRKTAPPDKPLFRVRSAKKPLKRRLQSEKFIRFFDCGYFKENNLLKNLPFLIEKSEIEYNDYIILVNSIISKLDSFKNTGDAIADFREEFQSDGYFPIGINVSANDSSFAFSITDSLLPETDPNFNTNWKKSGLKLESSQLETGLYISTNYNSDFILGNGSTNKITSVLDYDAPGVSFAPGRKFDCFLIPKIGVYSTFERRLNQTTSIETTDSNPDYLLIDLANMRWDKLSDDFKKTYKGSWQRFGSSSSAPFYYNAHGIALRMDNYGVSTSRFVSNASLYPLPPLTPQSVSGETIGTDLFFTWEENSQPEHFPVCIIRQNEQFFYVWS